MFSAIQHGAEIDPRAIGFAGLAITCLHSFTWVIAYFGVEGIARMGAAFTDTSLGILPLFLADKAYLKLRRRDAFHRSAEDNSPRGLFTSGIRSLREHALLAASPVTPDELCVTKSGSEEVLEIRACRAKPDWTPPRIVRHEDRYYRLEACSPGPAPRSFRYTLRRLSAGVPGRTVLVYSPDQTPQVADH